MPAPSAALSSGALVDLRTRQHHVLSRSQLARHGVGRGLIRRRVAQDRWQALGTHVVVLQSGPLSRDQQLWAGVLHAGPGAALGGLTALEVEGLDGFGSADIHVVAPHGRGRRRLVTAQLTVAVGESRTLTAEDVHPLLLPPRVRRVRATLDAAARASHEDRARALLAAVVQQRLVRVEDLVDSLRTRTRLPRRVLLLETLGDVRGGSQSLPELEYLRGMRAYGLPVPTRQRTVSRPGGHYALDADFDPWLVTVEVNGAQHLTLRAKAADDIRRTRLAIGGRLVVDLASSTVRHDIVLAVLLTADALRARGWQPDRTVRERLGQLADRHPRFSWTSTGGAA